MFWPSILWPDRDVELPGESAVEIGEELDEALLRDLEKRINPEQRRTLGESVRRLEEHPDDPRALEKVRALSRELDPDADDVQRRSDVAQAKEGALGLLGGMWQGPKNVLRVLTYYAMKRRAGIVGREGLGPFLRRLAASAPRSRVHLVAHSVGARLAAYGLNGLSETTPGMSPVKSFVMLQGILPTHAFASSLPSHPDRRWHTRSGTSTARSLSPARPTTEPPALRTNSWPVSLRATTMRQENARQRPSATTAPRECPASR